MKQFVFFITLFFVSLVLVSCANRKPQEPVIIEKTREVRTVVKDTVFRSEADSTYYHAWIECVNGKPVLKESGAYKNFSHTADTSESGLLAPKVLLTDGKLSVECYKQAQESFKTWRETYIKEHEQTPIYIEKPIYREKALSWFQQTQLWLGRIFLGVLALFTLVLIVRWKKII
ncbi:hypothetical protein ACM46_13770 [Chryseobacterium angstadtii]|uniref:Lipoprotein n=1 Tax=Chryseobacterium angstadtii TaxID=558151 RepID=A0A0J7I9D1_9FLAO|nr:hypothetical protein [Chryseobacterium angstadtii]KMQ63013.1 hypothetical protein ACM46_13770 [Chryseobacterium angstadtii]